MYRVFQVDTIRHHNTGGQPDWVKQQINDPYPATTSAAVVTSTMAAATITTAAA
jgi:hypothetical protein